MSDADSIFDKLTSSGFSPAAALDAIAENTPGRDELAARIVPTWQDIEARLHRGGPWWYYWTVQPDLAETHQAKKVSHWSSVGRHRAMPVGDVHVYFGVHPVTENRGPGHRSTVETIAALNCVFAEFDVKDFPDRTACSAHVASLKPEPSLVIDSGGGYHAYWFLADTFTISNDQDRARAKRLQAAWVEHVGGDRGAKDLARVLRVPGSRNLKYSPPRPVRVIDWDFSREYQFEDLERLVQPATPAQTAIPADVKSFSRTDDIDAAARNLSRLAGWRCDDYAAWVEVGMCLSELGEDGFALWDRWSQQSSKYPGVDELRAKWPTFKPGNGTGLTLATLAWWAQQDDPGGSARAAASGPGAGASASSASTGVTSPPAAKTQAGSVSAKYLADLASLGYSFRLNLLTDTVEVNGRPICDQTAAEIRCQMRDLGRADKHIRAFEDAYTWAAGQNSYHPVRAYLDSLSDMGRGYIDRLAGYFTERPHEVDRQEVYLFPVYLRRWLVGAVARAYQRAQNAMLVLDGPQDIGKSYFAKWICPITDLYLEAPIDPANKDCDIAVLSHWVWEVSELGATTRKADRESLKAFLSREIVTVRKAYGRYAITKPALASFIGTINNEQGILSDPTGSRRFNVCTIDHIDWDYSRQVDVNAVWAEALALYRAGENWRLASDEKRLAAEVNRTYEIREPIEDMIVKYFDLTRNQADFTTTADIADRLQALGYRSTSKDLLMQAGKAMQAMGFEKSREDVGGKRQWGYKGIAIPSPLGP